MTIEEIQKLVNEAKMEIDEILSKLATATGGHVLASTSTEKVGPGDIPEILVSVSVFSKATTGK